MTFFLKMLHLHEKLMELLLKLCSFSPNNNKKRQQQQDKNIVLVRGCDDPTKSSIILDTILCLFSIMDICLIQVCVNQLYNAIIFSIIEYQLSVCLLFST